MKIYLVLHFENGVFNAGYASTNPVNLEQHVFKNDDEWECVELVLDTETMEIG